MAFVNYIEKNVVTPIGEAMWAKVNTVVDYFEEQRKYVMNVVFNESDEKTMKAMFDKYLADAKSLPENDGKKWRSLDDPQICYKFDEKSGKIVFTFKTNAFWTKDGVETQTSVPIIDQYGKPFPKTTSIGNGSKVQVRFDPCWRHKSKDSNGLSMIMTMIMVHELVEYNGISTKGFDIKKKPDADTVFSGTTPDTIEDPFDGQ